MKRIVVFTAMVLACTAIEARAQMTMGSFKGYFTGHVGGVSGGDLTDSRLAAGASVSVNEQNGWGAELDFGHASDAQAGRQVLDINSYVVNGSWIRPKGVIRGFVVGGAGVIQINGCNSPCTRPAQTYDFGFSGGGGAYAVVSDFIGFRGDVRYFYTAAEHPDLQRPSGFGFWRAAAGVTLMWSSVP